LKCPQCHFDNREGARFCNECGNKLERTCPACGNLNRLGAKFCDDCGHNLAVAEEAPLKDLSFDEKLEKIQRYLPKGLTEKILSQRDKIEGERKHVTVMFCDMERFTSLAERLGPEDAYAFMDQVYEILIHRVHDFDGTVNEMTGDGIVALFGAPVALEEAPQRAIRSALAIHREMAKFSDRIRDRMQTPSFKMRIGIHTGPVVVGTLGNDLRVEFKAVGDTVNLASRMEELAEPGTTYVTDDTFKLTEGFFRFEGLGDRFIKGKEKPIKVFRVLAPSTSRTRFDVSSELGLAPFVGRQRELELLLDGFERVKKGRGQAFSIVSEAGLGKSRLLFEFRKAIANENVTFLEGKCLSYSRNVAYHPVIDILKSSFKILESDGDLDIKNKIKKGLKIVGVDEASTLPYLLELLSVNDSGIDQIPMSPEIRKDRIIGALNRIVLKNSEIRPVVMAIEDLHWIDKSSEERYKSLLDNISGARILLIFTHRPEFVHTWGGRSYHSHISLNRLSNRESLMMVSHLLGTEKVDSDLENMILDKTEGVPFFIEEFIKSLKDLKAIEKKDNTLCLAEDLQDVVIPSRIQDVIMARVDSLPEGAKEVLQLGSVIGREFGYKLLKQVIKLPEEKLLSHLSIIKESELLYERGIYPDSTYVFKHALTQESIYQCLLKNTRQKYHQTIAVMLEQHFPETKEAQPETLGHHFTEAGLAEPAIPYWQRAGEIAVRHFANIEAIDHLTKGLDLLKTLPETHERMRQEINLLIAMGSPLRAIKGYAAPEVKRSYVQARELCQKVGETPQLFQALRGLFSYYFFRSELQTANELGEQLFHLAQSKQEPALISQAHYTLLATSYWLGKFASAQVHLEQGIALYNPQLHRSHTYFYGGTDPAVTFLVYAARILWLLGYPDQAVRKSHEALTLARELSQPFTLAYASVCTLTVLVLCREAQASLEKAEETITISSDHGFPQWLAAATVYRGYALNLFCSKPDTTQGQIDYGIVQIRQGLDDWIATGSDLVKTHCLALLAEAYLKVGQAKKGLTVLAEALDAVKKTGVRLWEAELYRLKGELLIAQSAENHRVAESCFKQALEIAQRQQAKSWELRATMSLSRLWQSQGNKEDARSLLSEIYGWFTEGFDTADLKDAKALLDVLS
jgi:predicted ATPase/class 3 adenylate cyclase